VHIENWLIMATAVRVYISGNSGNKEMVTHQHRIMMILDSLHIEFEVVDIAGAAMEEAKEFMRTNGKKKDNQRHVLPPQIFNGDKYCGDYDDFDIANEDDTLEEFLGLPKKDPPVDPNAPPKEGEPGKPDQPAVNGEEPMSVDKAEVMKEEAELEGAKEE